MIKLIARPAIAVGASASENRENGIWEKCPMIMFCGLPTSVATLPMLALVASAIRYGSSGSFPRRITAMTSGVNSKQDRVIHEQRRKSSRSKHQVKQQSPRCAGKFQYNLSGSFEKTRERKVGGHQHHREQEHDRVIVDRAIGALRCHYPGGDHQYCTEQSRGGTIQRPHLELSTADGNVSDSEDHGCDQLLLPVIHSGSIAEGTPLFNEHNFFAKRWRNA